MYNLVDLDHIPWLEGLSEEVRFDMRVVSQVLPFRTNSYVLDNLIDWTQVPNDPIFRLNFMHRDMLQPKEFNAIANALIQKKSNKELKNIVFKVRKKLNPHPAGQMTENVPKWNGVPVSGIQHKYRETCLVFPANSQTCFAYCTFCFRWPQFVELDKNVKFSTDPSKQYLNYIRYHPEITDILITGGDPMIMNAKNLEKFIEPFLGVGFEHIQNIRIGTKVLGHWPYRFLSDSDADDILRLYERIVKSGKHLAIMSHFTHPAELDTAPVKKAVKRIRSTGAIIRTQSPLVHHINNAPEIWAEMWRKQVAMGMIPYYMFIERDTGPRNYFEVPLHRALHVYKNAIEHVSGLARTVRGPSMSTFYGKVCIEGITKINKEEVFVLNFLQGRNAKWVKQPFFAEYDDSAVWLDDLKPAFGKRKFFFES